LLIQRIRMLLYILSNTPIQKVQQARLAYPENKDVALHIEQYTHPESTSISLWP
jgi:hypothetical protein